MADTFAGRVAVTRKEEIVYSLPQGKAGRPVAIRERLVGADKHIKVQALDKSAATVSLYPGRDRSQWQTDLPTYNRVALGRVAPGIQAVLEAHTRNVEKLFYVDPGADPNQIRLAFTGAKAPKVEAAGHLELATTTGSLQFTKPVAFQEIDGQRRDVAVRYQVHPDNTYGFILGQYDTAHSVVIDPLFKVWAVQYDEGLANPTAIMDATADAQGNIYAAGYSNDQHVIYKLDSKLEKLLKVAYFGSEEAQYFYTHINAIDIDNQGNIFVAGTVLGDGIPVTDGCHDAMVEDIGEFEGFVCKFSADLVMQAATYVGGAGSERLNDLVVDGQNRVYVTGFSSIPTLPESEQPFPVTENTYDTNPAGRYLVYKTVIARLDNDLTTVEAATFLGGSQDLETQDGADVGHCLALSPQGEVWVAGHTMQSDFPAFQGSVALPTAASAISLWPGLTPT